MTTPPAQPYDPNQPSSPPPNPGGQSPLPNLEPPPEPWLAEPTAVDPPANAGGAPSYGPPPGPSPYGQAPAPGSGPQFGVPAAAGQATDLPQGPPAGPPPYGAPPSGYAGAAPAGYAPTSAGYGQPPGYSPPPPPRKRSRRGALLAGAIVVALVLVGVGAFAWVKLANPSGSKTADDAAKAFIEGVLTMDFNKAGAAIAPSERVWVSELMEAQQALDTSGDPDLMKSLGQAKDAIKITVNDLEISSSTLVNSVSRSVVTGGSVRVEAKDPDALAQALLDTVSSLQELINDSLGGLDSVFGPLDASPLDELVQTDKADLVKEINDAFPVEVTVTKALEGLGLNEFYLVTVEEDGLWYTSISMTVAQFAWEAAGMNNADLGNPVPADQMAKQDSPEAAAQGFAQALDKFLANPDPAELAKYLAPAESRLLAVYGPALLARFSGTDAAVLKSFEGREIWQSGGVADVSIGHLEVLIGTDEADYTLKVDSQDGNWAFNLDGPDLAVALAWLTPNPNQADITLQATAGQSEVEGSGQVLLDPNAGTFGLDFEVTVNDLYWDDQQTSSLSLSIKNDEMTYQTTDEYGENSDSLTVPGLSDMLSSLDGLPSPQSVFVLTAVKSGSSWQVSPVATLLGMANPH